MCAGWGCKLDFRLILASNWGHYTGRGSSQHLRTLERVPVNKKLLTGTVPVNNLFLNFLMVSLCCSQTWFDLPYNCLKTGKYNIDLNVRNIIYIGLVTSNSYVYYNLIITSWLNV